MRALLLSAFRSRLGVALILIACILAVVTVSRVFGPRSVSPAGYPGPVTIPSSLPSYLDDDGATGPEAAGPSVATDAAPPVAVAEAFASEWLHRERDATAWTSALRMYATNRLLTELDGAIPASVPDTRPAGEPRLIPQDADLAEVEIPLHGGVLRLRVVGSAGHWLVDGVDWIRG